MEPSVAGGRLGVCPVLVSAARLVKRRPHGPLAELRWPQRVSQSISHDQHPGNLVTCAMGFGACLLAKHAGTEY